jgi:hypothetical protein
MRTLSTTFSLASILGIFVIPLILCCRDANATTLLFNTGTGGLQAHGDAVTSTVQNGHSYTKGFGWSPQVLAEYGDGAQSSNPCCRTFHFGNLVQPVLNTTSGVINVTFTADDGWDVVLESFNIAGWYDMPGLHVDHVIVWNAEGESLFLESQGTAPNNGHRTLTFDESIRSTSLRLEISTGAAFSRAAIDEVSFYQVPSGSPLGDANKDGTVTLADFSLLKADFGKAFASASWERGDFNSDRLVDLTDFSILKDHFDQSMNNGAAVPEPSAWVLGILATVGAVVV